ncbi:hypothetical protein EMPS_05997 [Entomortierella parvispora]|uniref:Thymocyte nuclear protein 1 n=1 Tax=Entomortierella parvispora TaxID=205924 RepID=A0A9P3HBH3_9FUNG|nr:hypothetical protein EMPS_05997 [Entomortierella parvispora]
MKTRSKRQADASGETSGSTEVNTPVAKKIRGIKAVDKPAILKSSKSEQTAEAPKDQNVNGDKADRTSVWLMKSEPDTFSIDDLIKSKDSTSQWDGVRNHEAKNLMKHNMKVGDTILFYHSNTKEPGIVGLAKVAKDSYPDYTAFDPKSPYYDAKSTEDDPRWYMVDVKFDRKLRRVITLKEMQIYKDKELKNMRLLNRGRLSVLPVSNDELDFILKIEQEDKTEE